jgi:hypothetical protein
VWSVGHKYEEVYEEIEVVEEYLEYPFVLRVLMRFYILIYLYMYLVYFYFYFKKIGHRRKVRTFWL